MKTRLAIPSPRQEESNVFNWNIKNKVGCKVEVTLDDGSIKETVTDSEAWMLGGHTAVIKLEGMSGGFALRRVRAIPPTPPTSPESK